MRYIPPCPSDSAEGLFVLPSLDSVSSALHVEPSTEDCSDERFIVRNLLLEHGWQYGLSVTPEKREALSIGDLAGRIVDPILVRVCELMGHLVRLHSHPEAWLPFNTQTVAEAELDQPIRDKLESASGLGTDPLLCLQAYTLLSQYSAQKEDIRNCQEFLVKASNIAIHHAATLGLEDSPACAWSPKFDSSYLSPHNTSDEARAAFSQMIYLDIQYGLILNLPSVIDPGLGVHWADTEINFIRAKSILFLNDSKRLVFAWNRWDFGDPTPTTWSKNYWSLIEDIHAHIGFLNTVLMDVSCIPALQGAEPTLKTCSLMSLAALAELYGLFALSQPESRRKHQEVVLEITNITQRFSDKDYQYLDPILSVCWSTAWRTLPETPEWATQTNDENVFRSGLLFLHAECNRKLRRASPFAVPL
ncbi:hypothetical protein MVEN_02129400 [Mycena venus]|uniref:Uncharacterized protein n=1 Tax=Mycena venus TaxID=2733690 RepID=A0A8H6X959_9AGAR|nr:hypothetical protein MVEN_02129400 [Mycena venus]